ncbi:MAG TPA: hypothetical protein PLZ05_00045 [Alphaproteobacteria bacterium]|nr:hypothetical protein [Alphaproteobacteria bacterium]
MKLKYLVLSLLSLLFFGYAKAEVTLGVCTLSSCATGYYLDGTVCTACITPGTSVNYNTGGITSCFIPAGTSFTDTTGTYTYNANCSYSI